MRGSNALNSHMGEHRTHRADKMSGSITKLRRRGANWTRGTKDMRRETTRRTRHFLRNPENWGKF